jgi:hypothetical protein
MKFPRRPLILALAFLAAIALIAWFSVRPANALPQPYRNNAYGFSLRLPADYTVKEVPSTNPPMENGPTDIIEFAHANGNIQLTVSVAADAPSVLTTQSLLSNYPLLAGVATEPFPIAPGTVGLALHHDSAHPDQISDVWFARDGYLYQLTAFGDGYNELLPIARTITLF